LPEIVPSPPPGFDDLSIDEQIDYIQSLWDRIAASPAQVPVPEWHERIIRERLEVSFSLCGETKDHHAMELSHTLSVTHLDGRKESHDENG
jgi:hypothetical protein